MPGLCYLHLEIKDILFLRARVNWTVWSLNQNSSLLLPEETEIQNPQILTTKKKKKSGKGESVCILKAHVVIDELCPRCSYGKQLNDQ